jgi:poly(A) polymerase
LELSKRGFKAIEAGVSALDRYHRPARRAAEKRGFVSYMCDAGQADIARFSDGLEYPGTPYADIGTVEGETQVYALCDVDLKRPPEGFWRQGDFYFDPLRNVFADPYGNYPILRSPILTPAFDPESPWPMEALLQAAVLVSRFDYRAPPVPDGIAWETAPARRQRDLLCLVLTGAFPWKGLELLRESGFVRREWPEAAQLLDVEHSKEFHPEGGAWEHTLETFRYRKDPDLTLSLALFLHDAGKPLSASADGRRFDRHAELGALAARRLLERLGFGAKTADSVCFLVRQHMLPAALPRLPLFRAREALESPLFPSLLELYRCDSSSTFMGPGGYYEACAAYKAYLRNARNPYREADGSKKAEGKRGSRGR